jgi:hypothetical protein
VVAAAVVFRAVVVVEGILLEGAYHLAAAIRLQVAAICLRAAVRLLRLGLLRQ